MTYKENPAPERRPERREASGGIFTKFTQLMSRNRLGELLVQNGLLTPHELRFALARQKSAHTPLGRVLVAERMVTRQALYRTLAQQMTLRGICAAMTIIVGLSSFGIKQARAGTMKDIPAQMTLVSTANTAFSPVAAYPALFGSGEKRSHNLSPFTKWTGMFERFEKTMASGAGARKMENWRNELQSLAGLPLGMMAERVNSMVNEVRYVEDMDNWGRTDYWATPIEFFSRGGDCEDFAIAKYTALRALGVPEERLRVAIVHDKQKDIPHAVLIVYTDDGALMLDNQNERVVNALTYSRYRPIFSINRQAWWLHTQDKARTIVASAD